MQGLANSGGAAYEPWDLEAWNSRMNTLFTSLGTCALGCAEDGSELVYGLLLSVCIPLCSSHTGDLLARFWLCLGYVLYEEAAELPVGPLCTASSTHHSLCWETVCVDPLTTYCSLFTFSSEEVALHHCSKVPLFGP